MTAEAATAITAPTAPAAGEVKTGDAAAAIAGQAAATAQQQTDGKTETKVEVKAGDAGTKEGEAPAGAPDKYEDFKLPEGVKVDPEMMAEFTVLAKDLKLNQKDAQRATDLGAKLVTKIANKSTELLNTARAGWIEEAKADKEFGGVHLAENLAVAKKALDAFGSPKLREMLNQSGLGDNPEFIRAFVKIGKSISEDKKIVRGGGPTPDATAADALYPNQQNKQ